MMKLTNVSNKLILRNSFDSDELIGIAKKYAENIPKDSISNIIDEMDAYFKNTLITEFSDYLMHQISIGDFAYISTRALRFTIKLKPEFLEKTKSLDEYCTRRIAYIMKTKINDCLKNGLNKKLLSNKFIVHRFDLFELSFSPKCELGIRFSVLLKSGDLYDILTKDFT